MKDDWLDTPTLQSLTVAQIVARVDALKPLIAANAREAELQRHPVDEVWAALRRTGVFYLFVPKKYGGLEAGGLQALIDVVTSIARELHLDRLVRLFLGLSPMGGGAVSGKVSAGNVERLSVFHLRRLRRPRPDADAF